jgi:hypothetical protein
MTLTQEPVIIRTFDNRKQQFRNALENKLGNTRHETDSSKARNTIAQNKQKIKATI